jgi:hypothetical protein
MFVPDQGKEVVMMIITKVGMVIGIGIGIEIEKEEDK